MMKHLLIFLTILGSGNLFGQTIDGSNLPDAGDTRQSQPAESTGIEPGMGGTGMTWDFSSLTTMGDATTSTYLEVSETPFAADFPDANIAAETSFGMGNSYSYYNKSGGNLELLGVKNDVSTSDYTDTETVLSTPLAFGDSFSDSFAGVTTSSVEIKFVGDKTAEVDGTGTLILPSGTYANATRLFTEITRADSSDFSGTISVTETETDLYSWYLPGVTEPVLLISISEGTSTTFIDGIPPVVNEIPPSTFVSVAIDELSATSEIQTKDFSLSILGSNIVEQDLDLTLNSSRPLNLEMVVTNAAGQVMNFQNWQAASGSTFKTLDFSNFPSGQYFIQLTNGQVQRGLMVTKI